MIYTNAANAAESQSELRPACLGISNVRLYWASIGLFVHKRAQQQEQLYVAVSVFQGF